MATATLTLSPPGSPVFSTASMWVPEVVTTAAPVPLWPSYHQVHYYPCRPHPGHSPVRHHQTIPQLATRAVLASRRRFLADGRSLLLWAEDAPELSGAVLLAVDEWTGMRGSTTISDEELRESYGHFARGRLQGLTSELGLSPRGRFITQSLLRDVATCQALLPALMGQLLDTLAVQPGDGEWILLLPSNMATDNQGPPMALSSSPSNAPCSFPTCPCCTPQPPRSAKCPFAAGAASLALRRRREEELWQERQAQQAIAASWSRLPSEWYQPSRPSSAQASTFSSRASASRPHKSVPIRPPHRAATGRQQRRPMGALYAAASSRKLAASLYSAPSASASSTAAATTNYSATTATSSGRRSCCRGGGGGGGGHTQIFVNAPEHSRPRPRPRSAGPTFSGLTVRPPVRAGVFSSLPTVDALKAYPRPRQPYYDDGCSDRSSLYMLRDRGTGLLRG
mmetsp:Transcript_90538/g.189386  ORF Transcript_90538/g.189386 Transcript_90538/m.189386 type:complete len:453 (+) Transcript_90538:206-1564(+)